MAQYDLFASNCPLRFPLSIIKGKWGSLIILALKNRPMRFSELCRSIGGISERMASQSLKYLVRYGLVRRSVVGTTNPPQVSYALTPLGRQFAVPLTQLAALANDHADEILWEQRHG
ncbi:MAG: helix-turn-helix domain-containing protein [Bifidobacterium sp.]|nr:helix-turn-helix domain-containing protein [Bifidobacterium sp.]